MERNVLIFDGECNLCNGLIGRIIKLSDQTNYRLLPYQSPEGQAWLKDLNMPPDKLDTVIVIGKNYHLTLSDAFLHILKSIPLYRPFGKTICLVPKNLRDPIYKYIAQKRLKFFGSSSSCRVVFNDQILPYG